MTLWWRSSVTHQRERSSTKSLTFDWNLKIIRVLELNLVDHQLWFATLLKFDHWEKLIGICQIKMRLLTQTISHVHHSHKKRKESLWTGIIFAFFHSLGNESVSIQFLKIRCNSFDIEETQSFIMHIEISSWTWVLFGLIISFWSNLILKISWVQIYQYTNIQKISYK